MLPMPGRCREAPDHVEDRVRPNGGKTVTKSLALIRLGLPLSEKQIPQVVENLESGGKPKEALERAALRPRQVRYRAARRPDIEASLILKHFRTEHPSKIQVSASNLIKTISKPASLHLDRIKTIRSLARRSSRSSTHRRRLRH
jgi:hypothetical protein